MDLSLSEDQRQIIEALDGLSRPYATVPMHDISLALTSDELDGELAENGFLDVALMDELGPESAAMVVERLARLPFAVEAAASAMLRPLLDPELPRPLCVVREGDAGRAVRFLKPGATVVLVGTDAVHTFTVDAEDVDPVSNETLFAYPMGVLKALPSPEDMREHDIAPAELLAKWRAGLAAEAAGLLAGALESTVTYVGERKQFGRPIATFQAMRHRLAEDQVLTNGVYWLAMRAATTGDTGDAALALTHAQEAAKKVTYDYHQFLGAMGMTLEHPLHLWTYRLKALTAELGGRGEQALAAAEAIWG
jgi:hypothetical protein